MKKSRSIKNAIADFKEPLVMIALTKGEVASKRVELQAFTDGNGLYMVSNLPTVYSIVDGKRLSPVEKASKQEVTGENFEKLDELTTMKSSESDQLIGVDTELAFALVGEEMFCPITGKSAKLSYIENAVDGEDSDDVLNPDDEDNSDDDSSDDEEVIVDDSDDDSSDGDDSEEDSAEEDDAASDDDSGDDISDVDDSDVDDSDEDKKDDEAADTAKSGFETPSDVKSLLNKYKAAVSVYETADGEAALTGNVVKVLKDDTFVVTDDSGSTYTVKSSDVTDGGSNVKMVGSISPVEAASQTVYAAETADPSISQVRIMSMTGNSHSEVAVFVGDTHIGTMYRNKASEKAAALFNEGTKLHSAFKSSLIANYGNQRSSELAKFGYEPKTFEIKVGDLFQKRLDREIAKVQQQSEIASTSRIGDVYQNLELAFLGINKGVFKNEGKNDLVVEMAKLLRRGGVANPELEARKLLARNSNGYIKGAIEKAKELSTKSEDYLAGVSDNIANTEFVGEADAKTEATDKKPDVKVEDYITKPVEKTEVANFDDRQPSSNRFASVIRSISRR